MCQSQQKGEAAPGNAAPGEATPGDAAPGNAAPGDATPGDVHQGTLHLGKLHRQRLLQPGRASKWLVTLHTKASEHCNQVFISKSMQPSIYRGGRHQPVSMSLFISIKQ